MAYKVVYTRDSKKRGQQTEHRTQRAALRSVKCSRRYPKSVEREGGMVFVACGETPVAFVSRVSSPRRRKRSK